MSLLGDRGGNIPEKEDLMAGTPLGVGGFLGRRAFWRPLLGRVDPKDGSPSDSGTAGERHTSMSGRLLLAATAEVTWQMDSPPLVMFFHSPSTPLSISLYCPDCAYTIV